VVEPLTLTVAREETLPAELFTTSVYVVVCDGETTRFPLTATLPPFIVADVPPLDVQRSVELCPLFIVDGDAVNELIAGGLPALTAGLNSAIRHRYCPVLAKLAV
jgi:hypothetical protein